MRIQNIISAAFLAIVISSCGNVENIPYFQDVASQEEASVEAKQPKIITVQPGDKISIIVNCRTPELTQLFNLPYTTRRLGQTTSTSSYEQGVSGYSVAEDGTIDFPILGKLFVKDMTRSQIASLIKNQLQETEQASDAVVTVEFMNLRLYVLGEVKSPGKYGIDQDIVTVIDAISMAGDLTIYGKRENVMVKRVVDGKEMVYSMDLKSAENIMSSPGYYLKQNDVVYVEPNRMRARQSTVNGNNLLSLSFWLSVTNLVVTIAARFI